MNEEILPNLFRIVVPLPNNPLKAVNCYVITSNDRNLIIDTGADQPECKEAMESGLSELGVDRSRTDFFITHMHSDHIGLLPRITDDSSKIYFNQIESDLLSQTRKKGGFKLSDSSFTSASGLEMGELDHSFEKNPALRYTPPNEKDLTILDDGACLTIGDYTFECISTPGHSPGHMCLYEREKKLMICGDHVLNEISPNIATWQEHDDPLTDYYASLAKVRDLDVELALPGHRSFIQDFRGRIDELIHHHDERLDEVLEILNDSSMFGVDVASRMSWNMKYDHWDDVGLIQKWFATGEAVAHLRHLETHGHIRSEMQDDKVLYTTS